MMFDHIFVTGQAFAFWIRECCRYAGGNLDECRGACHLTCSQLLRMGPCDTRMIVQLVMTTNGGTYSPPTIPQIAMMGKPTRDGVYHVWIIPQVLRSTIS